MHFFTVFVALLLLYAHHTTVQAILNTDSRNHPTQPASDDEYPFLVSIGRKGNERVRFTYRQGHFCGGALFAPDRVLTAAHCLNGEKKENLRVIVGMTRFSESTEIYEVSGWFTYNNWPGKIDSDTDHDVAVIALAECVREPNGRKIHLYPKYLDKDEFQLETVGWGQTEEYRTAPVLLKIDLRLVPLTDCEYNLELETNKIHSISMQHMCTRSKHKMYLGEGDSGGPLILREDGVPYVVGINEAYVDGSTRFLNTHMRISYYKRFIVETIHSSSCTI